MVIITMVLWVEHMQLSLPFLLPSRLLAFVCFILDLHEGSVSTATPAAEHCWLFILSGRYELMMSRISFVERQSLV